MKIQIWKCPVEGCDYTCAFGISVGGLPTCPTHHQQVVPMGGENSTNAGVTVGGGVGIGGNVNIGGSLRNAAGGKITVSPQGQINISSDTLNEGSITVGVSDMKALLLECVKTAGNLADLGAKVIDKFFK